MISHGRGESTSGIFTHPKGSLRNDKEKNCNEEWGNHNFNSHSLRVGFINIQTFPTHIGHHKNNNIIKLFHDYHLSVLGLAEINLFWPSLPHDQQMSERTRRWFEHTKSFTSCNMKNTHMKDQRGGTATILRDKIVHTSYGCRSDHLGRWMTMTFRGRDGHNFHTITAYRPQPNTNPYGVYQQLL